MSFGLILSFILFGMQLLTAARTLPTDTLRPYEQKQQHVFSENTPNHSYHQNKKSVASIKQPTLLTEEICLYDLSPQNHQERFCLEKAVSARRSADPTQEASCQPKWRQNDIDDILKERLLKNHDRRACVVDADSWPWRVNGHLSLVFSSSERYLGSGTLIGSKYVLTAAHNIYDKDKKVPPQSVYFYPGQSYDKAPWSACASKIILHPLYYTSETLEESKKYDIGLVILEEPLGTEIGFITPLSPDKQLLKNKDVTISGYPGMPGNGHCMYTMTGPCSGLDKEAKRIFYDIDTTPGQSGSGILAKFEKDVVGSLEKKIDQPWNPLAEKDISLKKFAKPVHHNTTDPRSTKTDFYCIGTHTHGNDLLGTGLEKMYNSGTFLNPDLFRLINTWIDQEENLSLKELSSFLPKSTDIDSKLSQDLSDTIQSAQDQLSVQKPRHFKKKPLRHFYDTQLKKRYKR